MSNQIEGTTAALELQKTIIEATMIATNPEAVDSGNSEDDNFTSQSPPDTEGDLGSIQVQDLVVTQPDNTLFYEDFSNNSNGWKLLPENGGTISVVQNRLRLVSNYQDCIIAPIPNLTVENKFYVEVLVELQDPEEYVGFALGSSSSEFNKYGIHQYNGMESLRFEALVGTGNSTNWSGDLLRPNRDFKGWN